MIKVFKVTDTNGEVNLLHPDHTLGLLEVLEDLELGDNLFIECVEMTQEEFSGF